MRFYWAIKNTLFKTNHFFSSMVNLMWIVWLLPHLPNFLFVNQSFDYRLWKGKKSTETDNSEKLSKIVAAQTNQNIEKCGSAFLPQNILCAINTFSEPFVTNQNEWKSLKLYNEAAKCVENKITFAVEQMSLFFFLEERERKRER